MNLNITLLPDDYSIVRLDRAVPIPEWATGRDERAITSITRSGSELSIVSPTRLVPETSIRSDGWRCLRFEGPFDLSETGVLASVVGPLAEAQVSVFALATFDTDYVLVREAQLDRAIATLHRAGHTILRS